MCRCFLWLKKSAKKQKAPRAGPLLLVSFHATRLRGGTWWDSFEAWCRWSAFGQVALNEACKRHKLPFSCRGAGPYSAVLHLCLLCCCSLQFGLAKSSQDHVDKAGVAFLEAPKAGNHSDVYSAMAEHMCQSIPGSSKDTGDGFTNLGWPSCTGTLAS